MMSDILKNRIQTEMKEAMKARDARSLLVIRTLMSEIKFQEIENQANLNDAQILQVISKMLKQRQDSIEQFQKAERWELVETEMFQVDVLKRYLPPPLSEAEVEAIVKEAVTSLNATSMRNMADVMEHIKPQLQGKADMSQVSLLLKKMLQIG